MFPETVQLQIPFQIIVDAIASLKLEDKRLLWLLLNEEITQAETNQPSQIPIKNNIRTTIKTVLEPYTKIPYSHGDIICKAVFDEKSDCYLLVTLGWDKAKRIHGCLVHIDIIDDKIWVQRDETEYGVTKELVGAGISKGLIVLGFHPADIRPHTGYAVV